MESVLLKEKQIEESCGAIVWKREKGKTKFLLLHRADEDGVWEPPKGHRIQFETEKETAIRELDEELNIREAIFDAKFKEVLEYENSKGKIIRYIFFLVHAEEIELSEEHDSFVWLSIDELPKYLKYRDILEMYTRAQERISIL